jgi:hypothetical protein
MAQTKRSMLEGRKIGKRVPCGACFGLRRQDHGFSDVYCERCGDRGTVLFPLREMVERAERVAS